jgi:hypothetical protein
MGWYGVGCFDVLSDPKGRLYFIDSNFRMTGMSAYHFLVANHTITTPLLGFSGSFKGTVRNFENCLLPYAGRNSSQKILQLIALSHQQGVWHFNGALSFQNQRQLQRDITTLLHIGVRSQALEKLARMEVARMEA